MLKIFDNAEKRPDPVRIARSPRLLRLNPGLFGALCAGLLLFLPRFAGAEIPDPLRVALVPNLFPVSFLDEEGEADGVFPQVIREIARLNGFNIQWVEGSWNESLERARSGDIDLMISLIYSAERDEFLDYNSESVIGAWSQVFQAREGIVDTIFDLEGRRVGLMNGDQNAAGFMKLASSFNVRVQAIYFDSFDEIAEALKFGELEAGVFYSLYRFSRNDLIPTGIIFQPNSAYFAVPEGRDRDILRVIDETLAEWKADKDSFYYKEVMESLSPSQPELPRWLLLLFTTTTSLALVAGMFILFLRQQVRNRTAALLESQKAYRSTFMDSHVGIVHSQTDGRFIRANPTFCEYLNYKESDLIQLRFQDITHPDDIDTDLAFHQEMLGGKRESYHLIKRYITSDGRVVWGNLGVSCVRDEEGRILYTVGLVEDITSRMETESRLGDLENRYQGMFQNSYQMTAILDEMGRLIEVNDKMKSEFHLPGDLSDLIGRTIEEREWMGPMVSLRIQDMVDECLSTGRTIRHTIGLGETRSGKSLDLTIKPVENKDGNIRYCIIEAHDVTELMELTGNLERQVEERTQEIRDAQERLIEAEKMASLGRLVAGVAHEINTPVGVAKTGVSYLAEQIRDVRNDFEAKSLTEEGFFTALDSLDDLAGILDQNLERAVKLIQDFKLTSADQSSHEVRLVDVHEYLSAVMHSISPRLKKAGITWNIDAPQEDMCLFVGAINQILVNLTVNAASHAFDDNGGRLDITYRAVDGRRILIFSDNGKGIDDEALPQLFEPFFTTGRSRGFTGLGLNIVYNLVKDILGGTVTCENAPGGGAVFRVEYPDPDCTDALES